MTRKVNVTLTVALKDNGEKSQTTMQSGGLLTEKDGALALWYTEPDAESDVVTEVRVAIERDKVIISRAGFVSSCMTLTEGQEERWEYQTPYGAMELPVVCSKLCNEVTPAGGRLYAEYCVNTAGDTQGIQAVLEYLVEEVQE